MRPILFLLFAVMHVPAMAQVGGKRSFEFLNVPAHARLAGLGGVNVSLADRDLNFFSSNPSLVSDSLDNIGSAGYQFYLADVGQANFTYAHDFKSCGMITFGIQHMAYRNIQGYDDTGSPTGDFKSGETALLISKSHHVANFRLGATLKTIFSNIAGYRASAVALDIGGLFKHPHQNFTVGLVIKNLGVVLNHYTDSKPELPFDVQIGATLKPQYMPLRFSLTAFNLTEGDITYYDIRSGNESPSTLNKVFSHLNFGGEILLHKNVNLLLGYSYLMRQSLKTSTGNAGAGICFGFSAAIKSVEFVFSRSGYVAGNAGYSFTLSTNIQKIIKRR